RLPGGRGPGDPRAEGLHLRRHGLLGGGGVPEPVGQAPRAPAQGSPAAPRLGALRLHAGGAGMHRSPPLEPPMRHLPVRFLLLLFMAAMLSGCGYNEIQSKDEAVNAAW